MSHTPHPDQHATAINCAVLTVSDTRTSGTDTSGQLIQSQLAAHQHRVMVYQIVHDEPAPVRLMVQAWAAESAIQAIIINGGTGIAPRDTTYDAIAGLLTKTLPGFGELFRMLSYDEIGSRAMASRAIAGVCESTLLFSLPGSSNAVQLAMEKLILPELTHLTRQLQSPPNEPN
jgi:molybdenum cofactor biosynthesis protein B